MASLVALPVLAAEPVTPTVVQFEASGPEGDVEALRVSLDDWLRPLKLQLRRVETLPTGVDDSVAARVRVAWTEETCVVDVLRTDGVNVRHKELARSGAPLLVSESAALVAQAGVQELVLLEARKVRVSTQPPLVTAPEVVAKKKDQPALEVGVAAWFQSRSFDETSPFVFGGGGELSLALPWAGFRPSASLLISYQGPVSRDGDYASVDVQSLSFRLMPGLKRQVGAFDFEAGAGAGVDAMIARISSTLQHKPDRVDASFFVSALLGARWHLTDSAAVMLRVLLDVEPTRHRYTSDVNGTHTVLAAPWGVRPVIQLGVSFDFVRATP